jgi:(E)-4-hydroxy-3-methylbut-2-enyl-diphosphate synthase
MEGHTHIDAVFSKKLDPLHPSRRKTRCAGGGIIGGEIPPVVVADSLIFDKDLRPDFVLQHSQFTIHNSQFPTPDPVLQHPQFTIHNSQLFFLTYNDIDDAVISRLKSEMNGVVILSSSHANPIGEMRAAMHLLLEADCDVPVILRRDYAETDRERLLIKAAIDFGALLTDGFGDGIMLTNSVSECCDAQTLVSYMYGILQAARVRTSRTEYISCPGCGRTLFDLQTTIARVKAATSHLKGLKIGIMGCIVNGPGEMADADYGYVGAGRGQVNLYKGKECILRNIPENEAVEKLIQLIIDNDFVATIE